MATRNEIPKVALLIETSRGYGRGLLRGIVRYARLHGPWSFFITPGDFEQAVPKMKAWGGNGIIARFETPAVARAILETNLPAIGLDLTKQIQQEVEAYSRFAEIHPDSSAAANVAADHLLERSFKQFAFVGVHGRIWSEQRAEAFVGRIAREGYPCEVYEPPRLVRDRTWEQEQSILAGWLRELPKPIGLFACNDHRGRQVLEAAMEGGVRVPEDLAVVGMDNDDLLCELCYPPLSSVALNSERGGYEAAAMLDKMMQGDFQESKTIVVEPLWVTTRHSTDVLAIDDKEVSVALQFIRDQACDSIGVDDVTKVIAVSRRALEMRFRKTMGHSIHDEIQEVRLEHARRLLAETESSMEAIADRCSFSSASHFVQVFKRRFGKTPASYRTYVRCR